MRKTTIKLFLLLCAFVSLNAFAQKNEYFFKKELLKDFDFKGAHATIKKMNLPESEAKGYMRTMQAQYLSEVMNYDFSTESDKAHRHSNPHEHNPYMLNTCDNSGFDSLNFTLWTQDQWTLTGSSWTATPSWTTTSTFATNVGCFNSSRFTILTTPPAANPATCPSGTIPAGYDELAVNPTTGFAEIPYVAPGGSGVSVRLGNANTGAQTERLQYTFTVGLTNTQFTYQYAVVLNNPGGSHGVNDQPKFKVTLRDAAGNQIGGNCGVYDVVTQQAATDPTFVNNPNAPYSACSTGSFGDGIYYKPWTTVSLDLSAYISQTLTIEFRTFDCSLSGHFGYAYIDASCGVLQGVVNGFCVGAPNSSIDIIAPTGFIGYQWYGPNSPTTPIVGATNDTLNVINPVAGDVFYVELQNVSGCNSLMQITLQPTVLSLGNLNISPSCAGGANGSLTAQGVGGDVGGYGYTWTTGAPFPGGTVIGTDSSGQLSNIGAGVYYLHLTSGSCAAIDTFMTVPELPPSLTTTTDTLCGSNITVSVPAGAQIPIQWYDQTLTMVPGPPGTFPNYSASGLDPGETVTVTYINNTSGCRDSLRFSFVFVGPTFSNSVVNPCAGGFNGSITLTQTNTGYSPFDFSVTGPVTSSGVAVNSPINITSLVSGNYTVNVNTTGNPTCTQTFNFTLVDGLISVTADTLYVCKYDTSVIITAPANFGPGHQWYYDNTPTDGLDNPVLINGMAVTNSNSIDLVPGAFSGLNWNIDGFVFVDTASTTLGCKSVYRKYVKHTNINVAVTIEEANKCLFDSVGYGQVSLLSSSAPLQTPFTFAWYNATTNSNFYNSTYTSGAIPQVDSKNDLKKGDYYVIFSTADGCIDTATMINIADPVYSYDTLTLKATFCPGDTLGVLEAPLGFTNYVWHYYSGTLLNDPRFDAPFDSVLPMYNGLTAIPLLNPETSYANYYVNYSSNFCERRSHIVIQVTPPPAFIPDVTVNIFTPNGDGKNEKFYPFFTDENDPLFTDIQKSINYYADEFFIKIYDRWGKLVYESESYSAGWDGTKDGKHVDDGTYFWFTKYKPRCGDNADVVEKQGFVQVINQ